MTTQTMLDELQKDIEKCKKEFLLNVFFNVLFLIYLLYNYGYIGAIIASIALFVLLGTNFRFSYTYKSSIKLNTLILIYQYIKYELHTDDKIYSYSGKSFYLPDLNKGKVGQELLKNYVTKYLECWFNTFAFASTFQVIEDEQGIKIIIQSF